MLTEEKRFLVDINTAIVFKSLFPDAPPHANCLRWSIAGCVACHRLGLKTMVQAGSAGFLRDPALNEWIEFRWTEVDHADWHEDWLPEIHVWLAVGVGSEMEYLFDPSVLWLSETIKAHGMECKSLKFPQWNRIGSACDGLWYDACESACKFAVDAAKEIRQQVQARNGK